MAWATTFNGPNLGSMILELEGFDEAAFIADLATLRASLECGDSLSHNAEDAA
jgi:hypothetical protein